MDSDPSTTGISFPSRALSLFHRVPLLSFFFSSTSSGLLELFLPRRLRAALSRPRASLARWYVLGLVAALQVSNGLQWMTFGPISNTAEAVFGWSDPVIMLIGGIGAAIMVPLSLPVAWFVKHIGLRPTILVTAFVFFVGNTLQGIPLGPEYKILRIVFLAFASASGGFGAAFVQTAPSSLSVAWFPRHLRTFATSVIVQSLSVGIALGFFAEEISSAREAINIYLVLQAVIAIVLFACALLYLPECPNDAPSVAATTERHSFLLGVKEISKNWSVWLVVISMSLSYGIVPAWASILSILLRPLSISQSVTGVIGVAAQIVTAIGSFFFTCPCSLQDRLRKNMKLSILLLNILAALAALVFCLMAIGVSQFNTVTLSAMLVLAIALPQTTLPIGYEFSAELAYPVHESIPNALIILGSQTVNVIFYVFMSIATAPHADGSPNLFESNASMLWWMSVLTCVLQGLSIAFVRSRYTRLDLDVAADSEKTPLLEKEERAARTERDAGVRRADGQMGNAIEANQLTAEGAKSYNCSTLKTRTEHLIN